MRVIIVTFLLVSVAASPSFAETASSVRVATFSVPPFVIEHGSALTGFCIDIWEAIAARLGLKFEYQKVSEVPVGLRLLKERQVDLAVSGVFLTEERNRDFDFSYTVLETGLQIMVRDGGHMDGAEPLTNFLQTLFSRTTLAWLITALAFTLVPAHLFWLFERRHPKSIVSMRYWPGIFHAWYWSATTLLTQSEQGPRHPAARLLTPLWMFIAIIFVALYTAQLTSSLTVAKIHGAINGPADLPGKRVGSLTNSTSAGYLRTHSVTIREFDQTDDMFRALIDKKVDAILFSAASLRYFAAHEGKGLVRLVGPEFEKGDLGFPFPEGSALRRQVNGALLALREDGTYQQIYDKWFADQLR